MKYLAIMTFCSPPTSPYPKNWCETGQTELAIPDSCGNGKPCGTFFNYINTHYHLSNLEFKIDKAMTTPCISMSVDCCGCYEDNYTILSKKTENGVRIELGLEQGTCAGNCVPTGMCLEDGTLVFFNK